MKRAECTNIDEQLNRRRETLGHILKHVFFTQQRCFHQTVLLLVHIINLSNNQGVRFYRKTRVFDENTSVGLKKNMFMNVP